MEHHPDLANQCKTLKSNRNSTLNHGAEIIVTDVTREAVTSKK